MLRLLLVLAALACEPPARYLAFGDSYTIGQSTSRRAPDRPELVAGDGLHPSGAMYAEWVRRALPATREALVCPRGGE